MGKALQVLESTWGKGPVAGGSCLWRTQKMVCMAGAQDTGLHAARAAVVRRYQMRRESFLSSGHFHHHQVLARAGRVPACSGSSARSGKWLEKLHREDMEKPVLTPCCSAMFSALRHLCTPVSSPSWAFLGPCPQIQGRDSGSRSCKTFLLWHSPRGRPESADAFLHLRLRSPCFIPWNTGWTPLSSDFLGGKSLWDDRVWLDRATWPLIQLLPISRCRLWNTANAPGPVTSSHRKVLLTHLGTTGTFPLSLWLPETQPFSIWNGFAHIKMFVDLGKSTSLFLFPKMLKDKFFSPKFPVSLFLENVTEFTCYNLHEKHKHILNHGPWASCHHPPWSHSPKMELLTGIESLGTFGTLPFAACKQ